MSYILEALKKSQQERAVSAEFPALSLSAAPTPVATVPRWLLVVGVAVVLLLLVALWLTFRPAPEPADYSAGLSVTEGADPAPAAALAQVASGQTEASAPAAPAAVAEVAVAESVVTDVVSAPRPAVVVDPALIVRSRPAPPLPKSTVIPLSSEDGPASDEIRRRLQAGELSDFGRARDVDENEVRLPASRGAVASMAFPEGATLIEPSAQGRSGDDREVMANRADRAVQTRTLPPLSALRKLPDLIISSHIYSSEPAERSLSMNGRSWHEGDLITPAVTLQDITPEGIVVVVDGYPFHVNRQNGWQALAD